jgi:hypothetical protein
MEKPVLAIHTQEKKEYRVEKVFQVLVEKVEVEKVF